MTDKNTLIKQLKYMGISKGDTLLVHSSMKAIGDVDGGADTVIDALLECVCGTGKDICDDGMLVLPTHTWKTMSDEHNLYDPKEEPACVGIIPNIFMKRKNVLRSLHPTHSVAAFSFNAGKMAQYISGEEKFTTPCNREGCYGKLYDLNAKILLLGVGLNRNTYMHGVEEWYGIKERLTKETLSLNVKKTDEKENVKIIPVKMHKHFKPGGVSISENYIRMHHIFLEEGALREGVVGKAACMLMSARKVADLTTIQLNKNRDYFL